MATVRMGNPPQNFQFLIDSGSADLWVGGEGCHGADGGDCVRSPSVCFLRYSSQTRVPTSSWDQILARRSEPLKKSGPLVTSPGQFLGSSLRTTSPFLI